MLVKLQFIAVVLIVDFRHGRVCGIRKMVIHGLHLCAKFSGAAGLIFRVDFYAC
jgi:hypothetical protein